MNCEALGKRIRRKRQENGLTQEEAAELIGISLSYYGNIERGLRMPSVEILVNIANQLNVGMDVLLRDSLKVPSVSRFNEQQIGVLRTFLSEQQSALENWLADQPEEGLEEAENAERGQCAAEGSD